MYHSRFFCANSTLTQNIAIPLSYSTTLTSSLKLQNRSLLIPVNLHRFSRSIWTSGPWKGVPNRSTCFEGTVNNLKNDISNLNWFKVGRRRRLFGGHLVSQCKLAGEETSTFRRYINTTSVTSKDSSVVNSNQTSNSHSSSRSEPSSLIHQSSIASGPPTNESNDLQYPPDLKWTAQSPLTLSRLPQLYATLSKSRLASLVILTTMVGYATSPFPTTLSTLFLTTVGTSLCVVSANTINQFIESPYDAQMSRTLNRPLPRHQLTPFHAFNVGIFSGISGIYLLYNYVNPLTAFLGGLNILLYTLVYTPMKRHSIYNTHVGAVVGAIPPLMGFTATHPTLTSTSLLVTYLLYAWQFPHFNSLAHNLRYDYAKGGYVMMSVTDSDLNARVSLRYALSLIPVSFLIPYVGGTTWWYAIDSGVVNAALAIASFRFWKDKSDKTARELFFVSLIHLPVVLGLLMVHKSWKQPTETVSVEEENATALDGESQMIKTAAI